MNERQFNREVAKERIRATRRSIPFCVITLEIRQPHERKRASRRVVRLLHRNLRMTDQKAQYSPRKFGVLLVDTPEMGGRACLDRLAILLDSAGVDAKLLLKVHDPEGFDPEDTPNKTDRRFDNDDGEPWSRIREGSVEVSSESPMVSVEHAGEKIQAVLKRSVDIVGATTGLVFGAPVILGAMAAIRLTSSGPSVFKQTREGYRGRPFTIYKLRTMVVDAEAKQAALEEQNHRDGPAFKIEHDPRVTRIGQFLRKTCVDELPQLWNVLKGDMSLVGPRPLPWHESRACNRWHRRRLDVRPGMTCYWQVNKDAAETFDDWMRMDLRYIDDGHLLGDLRLIAQTIAVPVLGRGSK